MLNNLTGWHSLIILAVLIAPAVIVVLVVVVVRRGTRSSSRNAPDPTADPVAALQSLAGLRDRGLLSEAEYEAKRQELLGRI